MNINVSVKKVKRMFEQNENFILLDIRSEQELNIAKIPYSLWIPMEDMHLRHNELLKNIKIIVLCHTGRRSLITTNYLRSKGHNAYNLAGGIDAWAKEIDSTVQVY